MHKKTNKHYYVTCCGNFCMCMNPCYSKWTQSVCVNSNANAYTQCEWANYQKYKS